jgi:hypothetical protein
MSPRVTRPLTRTVPFRCARAEIEQLVDDVDRICRPRAWPRRLERSDPERARILERLERPAIADSTHELRVRLLLAPGD